jgi:glycosyltransferase involved in cell wall biosynthesis
MVLVSGYLETGCGVLMNILMIGPTCRGNQSVTSGQSMMFQLLLDAIESNNISVKTIDISETRVPNKLKMGGISFSRFFDYFVILPKLWFLLILQKQTVYLTTSQSRAGFIRDMAIIWPAWILRHKLVLHQFGGNYGYFFNTQPNFFRTIIKTTLTMADAIVVEGTCTKKQFEFLPNYELLVRVIHNGLPEKVAGIPNNPKSINQNDTLKIIFLSNLIETKGYFDLLVAVKKLVDRGRKIKCVFSGKFIIASDSMQYGDAESAQRDFDDFIFDNNLSEIVEYHEGLFGVDKKNAFLESHVFVLPTNYVNEGQPVSVLEAMAHGCAIITTDYRTIPAMVSNGENGFFVRYGCPDDISDKIEELIDNPILYSKMSTNNISKFRNKFTPDIYTKKMIELLDSV